MELRTRSAWIAIVVAPIGLGQALVRLLANGDWWPFWVDDIFMALLLGAAGWLVVRETNSTRARMLSAAWAGMLLAIWDSTFRHMFDTPPDGYGPLLTLTTLLTTLVLASSALGLVLSLPTSKRPFIGTRPPKD